MKNKLLHVLTCCSVATACLTPILSLTSCSKSTLDLLEESTINEFKQMCKYPHPSDKFLNLVPFESNVLSLSNYLMKRVEQLTGAKVWQDKYANLWFDIPYNDESLKDVPTIALQSHMDMVFAYDSSKYEKDKYPEPTETPIELVEEKIDGKRVIHSKDYKTSIGADNGIGVAAILALISNNKIKHGNLRIIFTNCEENAMQGAIMMVEGHKDDTGVIDTPATTPELLDGVKYVVNMDGGIGDSLCVACSGAIGSWYYKYFEPLTEPLQHKYELKVSGFTGGHSGGAPRNNLGNAVKAATEILSLLNKDIQIASMSSPGSTVYNVTPPECVIKFASETDISSEFSIALANMKSKHNVKSDKANYWKDLDNAKFELSETSFDKTISVEDSQKILGLNNALIYGMDVEFEDQGIKTSSNVGPVNLGIEDDKFFFYTATYSRSDSEQRLETYKNSNIKAAKDNGFEYLRDAQFHPWQEETNKKLFNLTTKALNSIGINDVKANKAHGGVEPAMWSWAMKNVQKINDGNCVCIGVNVANEHKPTESINVDSIKDCMKVVQYIFTNAKELS